MKVKLEDDLSGEKRAADPGLVCLIEITDNERQNQDSAEQQAPPWSRRPRLVHV